MLFVQSLDMRKILNETESPPEARPKLDTSEVARAIEVLLQTLPETERQTVLRRLSETLPPTPTPRAGPLLGTIVSILHHNRDFQREWDVPALRDALREQGLKPQSKAFYNAVSYLARRGQIKQICYGRYQLTNVGAGMVTSDEIGLEPPMDGGD